MKIINEAFHKKCHETAGTLILKAAKEAKSRYEFQLICEAAQKELNKVHNMSNTEFWAYVNQVLIENKIY